MENKNALLDIVKGLAILLVVCGHVIQRSMAVAGQDFFLNPVFQFIYSFHMPLFFFVSGYLMAISLRKRDVWDVLYLRARGLLVPFVSWGLIGMLTACLLNRFALNGRGIFAFLMDPLQVPVWFIWFLYTLFACSCLLLFSVFVEKWLGALAFVAVWVLLMVLPFNDHFYLGYVKWFYLFYLAGYLVSRHALPLVSKMNRWFVAVPCAVLFFVLTAQWMKFDYIYINQMHISLQDGYEVFRLGYRYLVGFLGIICLFWIGQILSRCKLGDFLAVLGFYSLDIYLVQRYLVEGVYPKVIQRMHWNIGFNELFFNLVFVPLAGVMFAVICMYVSKVFIRKNVWLNQFLLGSRA